MTDLELSYLANAGDLRLLMNRRILPGAVLMEHTLAGMEAARARGRVGGTPKGLTKKSKELVGLAATLYQSKKYTTMQICEQLKIGSKAILYDYLRHVGIEIEDWVAH